MYLAIIRANVPDNKWLFFLRIFSVSQADETTENNTGLQCEEM